MLYFYVANNVIQSTKNKIINHFFQKYGCKTFPEDIYLNNITTLWFLIKKDFFNTTTEEEVRQACLSCLAAILKKISTEGSKNGFCEHLENEIKTLSGQLLPNNNNFALNIQFLCCIGTAHPVASKLIVNDVLLQMINACTMTETIENKLEIFKQFSLLVDALTSDIKTNETIRKSAVHVCLNATTHENILIKSAGFEALSLLNEILDKSEREQIYGSLQILLLSKHPIMLRKQILNFFYKLTVTYTEDIEPYITNIKAYNIQENELLLDALNIIVTIKYFTSLVLDKIMRYFTTNIRDVTLACKCLKTCLNKNDVLEEIYLHLQNSKLSENLVNCFINVLDDIKLPEHIEFLQDVNYILQVFTNRTNHLQTNNKHIELVEAVYNKYETSKNPVLMVLLNGLITHLKVHSFDIEGFVNILTKSSIESKCSYMHSYAVELLANIINKIDNGKSLYFSTMELLFTHLFLEEKLQHNLNNIKNTYDLYIDEGILTTVDNIMLLVSWITKALCFKGSVHWPEWCDKVHI